jgi:hypothetical protein
MIEVKLYSVEGGQPTYNGSVLYDGKKLTSKSAGAQFKNTMFYVMNEAIITPDGDVYDPTEDPEGYINNMYKAYRSYGLTASKPQSTSTASTKP